VAVFISGFAFKESQTKIGSCYRQKKTPEIKIFKNFHFGNIQIIKKAEGGRMNPMMLSPIYPFPFYI
jgi:hypothetical protein